MARSSVTASGGFGQKERLECDLALAVPVLLDARFNFITQPETVERQGGDVCNGKFGHEAANHLPQKFGGFAGGNVLMVNVPVQPHDQIFQRPIA